MSDGLDRAWDEVGRWLPQLVGALVLLVLGLALAWLLGSLTRRLLAGLGADRLADRYGVHESLGRSEDTAPLSELAGRIVRVVLALVVIVAAISTLGIAGLEPTLNELLLYLPRIVAAVVLVAAGVVVGKLLGAWVERLAAQLAIEAPLGRIASATVIAVFALTAVAQLGVPTGLLMVLTGIVLVTVGLAAALAFGLGSRELARELGAGRYLSAAYALGDRIEVDAHEGEIVAFEQVAVVLRRPDGRLTRLPNHVLVESPVTTEPAEGQSATP